MAGIEPCQQRVGRVCLSRIKKKMSAPLEETTEDTAQGVRDDIVDKKGLKSSVVWRCFGFLKSDTKQSSVYCKLCRAHVPTKIGNTTNLFHHLKQRHPFEHGECKLLQTQLNIPK